MSLYTIEVLDLNKEGFRSTPWPDLKKGDLFRVRDHKGDLGNVGVNFVCTVTSKEVSTGIKSKREVSMPNVFEYKIVNKHTGEFKARSNKDYYSPNAGSWESLAEVRKWIGANVLGGRRKYCKTPAERQLRREMELKSFHRDWKVCKVLVAPVEDVPETEVYTIETGINYTTISAARWDYQHAN